MHFSQPTRLILLGFSFTDEVAEAENSWVIWGLGFEPRMSGYKPWAHKQHVMLIQNS